MYGCFEAIVIYGFGEPDSVDEIDPEWIDENYEYIVTGSTEVIRNNGSSAVYGVRAILNREIGVMSVDADMRSLVHRFYNEVGHTKNYTKLGYYLVVVGDVECCHRIYTPEPRRRSPRLNQ